MGLLTWAGRIFFDERQKTPLKLREVKLIEMIESIIVRLRPRSNWLIKKLLKATKFVIPSTSSMFMIGLGLRTESYNKSSRSLMKFHLRR